MSDDSGLSLYDPMAVPPAGHSGSYDSSADKPTRGSWTHHTLQCVVGCFRTKHSMHNHRHPQPVGLWHVKAGSVEDGPYKTRPPTMDMNEPQAEEHSGSSTVCHNAWTWSAALSSKLCLCVSAHVLPCSRFVSLSPSRCTTCPSHTHMLCLR